MKYSSSIFTSLLVLSMGMADVSQAAAIPDGVPFQGNASAQALQTQMASTTDRIIVKYRQPGAGAGVFNTMSQQVSQATGRGMSHVRATGTGAQVFKLNEMLSLEEINGVIQEIEADPDVEYAEPDKRVFAYYTPTDPRYNEQWHYYEETGGIGLPEAWDTTKGEGVIVAVVDTGYTEHPDLVDNLQLPGYDLITDTSMSNDGDGRDNDASDPGDPCNGANSSWHGTHTAGTVAAVGDNGIGVIGVAHKAKVLPVRVLGKCGGWLSDFADGIIWASGANVSGIPANPNPAKVISMSLGGDSNGCSQTMQAAVNTARQQGATIVVASGNASRDVAKDEPANCDGVIAVAASDEKGGRASFSNYGNKIDIAAPGTRILSTLNSGRSSPGSDSYEFYEGTSMSTPHVSGVAALLYSIKPDITPDEVEQVLKDTASPFTASCNGCGAGIVDAAAAVAAVAGNNPTPTPTPSPTPTPTPVPGLVMLDNGVAKSALSGQAGDELMFAIDVPANATGLNFTMSGGTGDADLYVRFGSESTTSSYDCRPYLDGSDEECHIKTAQVGRYYAMIHGYTDFSAVSIVSSYEVKSGQTSVLSCSFNDFANDNV